jgi:uncharacterized protein (TIGR00251 family)
MAERSWIEIRPGEIIVRLHVQPRASRRGLSGVVGGRLKARVTAAPTGGRANAAVVELVAEIAGVPKSAVRVAQGVTARDKTLRISTADPAATAACLCTAVGSAEAR